MIPLILAIFFFTSSHCLLYSVSPNYTISLQPAESELAHCYYIEKIR
jgi:hypothetical protein